ncbi:MAG: hypothetical protein GY936_14880 [Ignavibacteriae bacterium]|nr:hypothetical protein [Ignavibacteriota bacterium]|tara:strand:+ start:282 stop:686 length:405 start_codon:yes stop_codon:yes gene_type:complete
MINVDNLFNLFPSEGEDSEVYIGLTERPMYKLGMYKKLVLNFLTFKEKVVSFLKDANAELSEDEMGEAGALIAYTRAWGYIEQIEVNNPEHIEAIKEYSNDEMIQSLNLGIFYYERHEEYEKCAFLLQILNLSK